jgi:hypothetical protein
VLLDGPLGQRLLTKNASVGAAQQSAERLRENSSAERLREAPSTQLTGPAAGKPKPRGSPDAATSGGDTGAVPPVASSAGTPIRAGTESGGELE